MLEFLIAISIPKNSSIADLVKPFVMATGYLSKVILLKVENMKRSKVKREPSEEIDLLDTILSSLVELLEEKGILTQEEYEKRIMEKVKVK